MLEKHDIQDTLCGYLCIACGGFGNAWFFLVDKTKQPAIPVLKSGLSGAEYIANEPVVMLVIFLTGKGPAAAMVPFS